MVTKLLVASTLILLCAFAAAQSKVVTVKFPDAGDRDVWIATGLPDSPPTTQGYETKAESVDLPVANYKATDALFVWDHKTGNLASKTLKDVVQAGTWAVQPKDYQDLAQVKVHVAFAGNPVSAAIVALEDSRRKQTQLVDASSQGDATFFAVKPGDLKVTVNYKSKGVPAKPVTQIMSAPLNRPDAVPTLTVAVPEPTETVAPGSTNDPNAQAKSRDGKSQPSENPLGTILGFVVAIGVAVGAGLWIMHAMKKNPEAMSARLEQLGVQVPKPDDQPLPDPAMPATPVKPQPQPQIKLNDAAPEPLIVGMAAASATVSPNVAGPQLTSANGDAIPLGDSTVVGREPGLGLSLVGESTVSRTHAELIRSGDEVLLRDLGSTNGTYVNGAKISADTVLKPGDQVQFGAVRFRFDA